MFDRFLSVFTLENTSEGGVVSSDADLMVVRGYAELLGRFAGVSFNGGVYRLHSDATRAACQGMVDETFPEFRGRTKVFAMDWMGRQFGVDFARVIDGEPQILLFDPGCGECFEIPVSFVQFHDVELVESPEAVLAHDIHMEWRSQNPSVGVIGPTECVGLKVPLFLGGEETATNLEISDLEVYWSLMGQMRHATRNEPDGTVFNQTTIS